MSNLLKALYLQADELVDRYSVTKIDLLTQLGKKILPPGYWGGPKEGAAGEAQPTLYLTFDDGPHPYTTPYLLELLEEQGIKGTFFLIGSEVERHPELVEEIFRAGHVIGNHSYNHHWMPSLQTRDLEHEIGRTNDSLEAITGVAPRLFRPPFGIMDQRAADCLNERNMTPVYWGSAPEDWSVPGTHRVIRRVLWRIADGTLIVLHEGKLLGKQTIAAAKEIIYKCKQLGYELAKVDLSA